VTQFAGEGVDTLSRRIGRRTAGQPREPAGAGRNSINSLAIDFWKENDLAHDFIGNALANRIDTSTYEESSLSQWWYAKRSSGGLSSIGTFRLDGGGGADTLIGGYGNDTYVIDTAGDVVLELGVFKGGQDVSTDTVETPFDTALVSQYANVENVTLVGSAGIGAIGNAVANRLDGSLNPAGNRLAGAAAATPTSSARATPSSVGR
jgi:Ca2+-binding RTX toxin-like protein